MALKKMFEKVVRSYDLLNSIISFGLDDHWRRKAGRHCVSPRFNKVIDVGTGTGDLAFYIESISGPHTTVIGLDFSSNMIKKAKEKKKDKGLGTILILSDASKLPFSDNSVDCITTSFSFRNLTYKHPKATFHLEEFHRVLSPGGRFVIVESSQPRSKLIRKLFYFYASKYVPFIGNLISGEKGAYRYLGMSMANYYTPDEVQEMLESSGFINVHHETLAFGMAAIHVAEK